MAAALEGLAEIIESEGDDEPAAVLREEAAALRRESARSGEGGAAAEPLSEPLPPGGGQTTATLLALTQAGDPRARERLAARYVAVLRRFAHGRLPGKARDLIDTDDLVQITIQRAGTHLHNFKPQREGAFLAYLRRVLMNQVKDEIRRASRRPQVEPVAESIPDPADSPLDQAAEREALERYEICLKEMPEDQRGAVILRLEVGMSFSELAEALGKRSPDAGRMLFHRGLDRLSKLMREAPSQGAL